MLIITSICGAQEIHKVKTLTVDDKQDGYALISYKIPEDGFYSFTIDGGFAPKKSSTIYYCEYQLQLRSNEKNCSQTELNVASQAQDGNICYFNTNQKHNTVAGVFRKNDHVELCLVMLKSDVNGLPHNQINLTSNTLVTVQQMKPDMTVK